MSPRIRVWAAGACAGHLAGGDTLNAASWPPVEPADDYTAVSLLAFAYGTDERD
jgi:hypothetical protein